jgi:predicted dehydrogenase
MGGTHARAFAKLPDVQVAAVSSRGQAKAEKLAAELGARATTDDYSIIEDPSIDVISNTLPTHLHPEFTIAALNAGKHVLLEKPFALTAADCDSIIAAHDQSGKTLMLAHVVRFWPEYVAMIELIHSGKLGKPLSAVATRLSVPPGWADWFNDPSLSGGAVLDLSIHDMETLNWVMGKPTSIYARGHQAAPNLWNHIHAEVNYDGGAQAFVEGSELMPQGYPFTAGLRVLCERGVAEFRFRAGGASVEMGGGSQLVVYEAGESYTPPIPEGDGYERQIAYFVECVRSGKTPEHGTPEQGRLAVKMCNAARQSMETGNIIPL